jgi:carbamate kinase
LLAQQIGATMLIILTAIAYVYLNFLSSQQAPVKQMTIQEAESHLEHGEFLPGSMAPKVEAAIAFLRHSGQRVFIGLPEELPHLLSGAAGTQIVPSKKFEYDRTSGVTHA